jgi:hypothetical protein
MWLKGKNKLISAQGWHILKQCSLERFRGDGRVQMVWP